ncbi:tryptophan-rich sensory protein [Mycoplasmatota bacterium]|nr:tryptophan-rich sensory protein [Mycoplasmatota bacterium]
MILLKLLSVLTFILMIFMNYLANALPLGGNTTGDISGKYPTLFTPAGYTFSIWGLIYLLITIFVVMIFVNVDQTITKNANLILILFSVVNIFNILWLWSWHHDKILLSTILMLALLLSLLFLLTQVPKDNMLTYATFSIYAAWICVATIANLAILISKYDILFFMNNEYVWFYIVLAFSFVLALFMVIKEKNLYFGAVFLWAYIGILSKFIK